MEPPRSLQVIKCATYNYKLRLYIPTTYYIPLKQVSTKFNSVHFTLMIMNCSQYVCVCACTRLFKIINYQSEDVGALECDWVQEMDSLLMSTNKKVGVAHY